MIIAPHDAAKWVQDTFCTAKLGDQRRTNRLVDIAGRLAQNSRKSAAASCQGDGALLEGTYRFFRNRKIMAEEIRRAGFEQTVNLAQDIPELLALEDTTSLSYKHQVASELGKLGKPSDKARGWWVHSVLMLNSKTLQTVGLVHQEWWCRPDDKSYAELKESGRWLTASEDYSARLGELMPRVIAVCDREADFFEYLAYKISHQERFVVRASHMRKIEESSENLPGHLKSQPALGGYQVNVPQKGMVDSKGKRYNRKARTAKLEVRSASITFSQKDEQITLNAILAEETSPPKGEDPLSWLLLTREPVDNLDAALKVIRIYAARWRVEDFHKAWKTGAGAERQRMTDPGNLERAVSILAFVGVRLLQLRESFTLPIYLKSQGMVKEAKEVADMPCDTVLSQDEWRLLAQIDGVKRRKNAKVPSLQWAYQAIARLGGFYDSKKTGIAGWDTLWDGWESLQKQLQGYLAAKEMMAAGYNFSD